MTQTRVKHWRDSNDYRAEYFRNSPGILGFIWFCSQCGKPLLGKKSVEVDHVVPPSEFARKKRNRKGEIIKNDSLLARALNTKINTVAICAPCNKRKSNKIGIVTVKGVVARVIERLLFNAQKILVLVLGLILKLLYSLLSLSFNLLKKPFYSSDWKVKLGAGVFYIAVIIYTISKI